MANILSLSNVTGTPTSLPISSSPATLITYSVGENNYQAIHVIAMINLVTTSGTTPANVVYELKSGATVLETITKAVTAVANDQVITINLMAKLNAKATLTLTVKSSSAADATVVSTVQNTYILGYY